MLTFKSYKYLRGSLGDTFTFVVYIYIYIVTRFQFMLSNKYTVKIVGTTPSNLHYARYKRYVYRTNQTWHALLLYIPFPKTHDEYFWYSITSFLAFAFHEILGRF